MLNGLLDYDDVSFHRGVNVYQRKKGKGAEALSGSVSSDNATWHASIIAHSSSFLAEVAKP